MVPRLATSPCSRARNFCRGGPSWPRASSSATFGWVASRECGELDEVHAVVAVVVARVAAYPAYAVAGRPLARRAPLRRIAISARQRRADEALQPPLAGVSGHAMPRLSSEWGLPAPLRAVSPQGRRGYPQSLAR